MTDEKRVLTGEIVSDDIGGAGPDMQVPLQMPPGVQGMTLGQALLGQTRYWGYRRAINAYRRAVEDKVDMVRAVTNLYGAIEDLEAQKISFGLRDERHEIARLNVLTKLDGHRAARKMAEAQVFESELVLAAAKKRKAAQETLELFEQYNREAEVARAERLKLEEEQRLKDVKDGTEGGTFRKKLKEMERAKRDYDEMMQTKAEHITEFGGEDKLPGYLKTLYDNLEEDLGFRGA